MFTNEKKRITSHLFALQLQFKRYTKWWTGVILKISIIIEKIVFFCLIVVVVVGVLFLKCVFVMWMFKKNQKQTCVI